ncbi:MAG: LysR family transcriptional regulator [Myxococcales bacterium]|nr:LysR family transcriptional regulator [Myxococcales bacterium]
MQWDLLRTFESVARLGSLTAAARALEVSQSTVSRQLGKLEELAGSPLLLRQTPVRLTDKGEALLRAVRPMVDAALGVTSALEDAPQLHGDVTLTTVGELLRWVLAPELPSFYAAYPGLRLRILADNRTSSLAAGEADLALRMFRPERGELIGQKLHSESFGLYVAPELPLHPAVPWLGLCGTLGQIPEQRYAQRAFAPRPARLLLEDIESLALAVTQGLGVAVLPQGLAGRMAGLVEVLPSQVGAAHMGPIPSRDFWLVVHHSKQRLPKVRAVMEWLRSIRSLSTLGD